MGFGRGFWDWVFWGWGGFKIGSLLTYGTGLSCLSALEGQVWHFLQFHHFNLSKSDLPP